MCQPQHTRVPFKFPFQVSPHAWIGKKGPQVEVKEVEVITGEMFRVSESI